jgi:hypothetical protein
MNRAIGTECNIWQRPAEKTQTWKPDATDFGHTARENVNNQMCVYVIRRLFNIAVSSKMFM